MLIVRMSPVRVQCCARGFEPKNAPAFVLGLLSHELPPENKENYYDGDTQQVSNIFEERDLT